MCDLKIRSCVAHASLRISHLCSFAATTPVPNRSTSCQSKAEARRLLLRMPLSLMQVRARNTVRSSACSHVTSHQTRLVISSMLCHLPLPPQNETTALESKHPAPHVGLPVQVVFMTSWMRLPLIGLDARKSAKPFRGGPSTQPSWRSMRSSSFSMILPTRPSRL